MKNFSVLFGFKTKRGNKDHSFLIENLVCCGDFVLLGKYQRILAYEHVLLTYHLEIHIAFIA